ncbi:MAG: sigma-70 family RNA polymerase sigma factor [Phycisphaerales bacterium]|nr:sigma-70 family RNA polymerase sigma factor [Phycisphaerales bacterium]
MDQRDIDWNGLLLAARDGNRDAVTELLRHASPVLRVHVEAEIGTRWRTYLTADDVLQETYLDAFKSIHHFAPEGQTALLRWLKRIASSKVVDAVRAISREQADGGRTPRQVVGLDPYITLLTNLAGGPSASVSGRFARAEATTLLKRALARLPSDYRAVIEAFDLGGVPMQAVAAELNRTVGASYLLRKRALDVLREGLAAESTVFRAFS